MIEIEINNKRKMRINQTEADKIRNGIALENIDSNGEVYRRDLISEDDFVMLMNYYRYVIDNDIQDDFINSNGLTKRDSIDKDDYVLDNYEVK